MSATVHAWLPPLCETLAEARFSLAPSRVYRVLGSKTPGQEAGRNADQLSEGVLWTWILWTKWQTLQRILPTTLWGPLAHGCLPAHGHPQCSAPDPCSTPHTLTLQPALCAGSARGEGRHWQMASGTRKAARIWGSGRDHNGSFSLAHGKAKGGWSACGLVHHRMERRHASL